MMFKGFSISTLAVLPLLLTSAIAHPAPEAEPEPESLETRSLDATVKWHGDRKCGDSGGPKRDYSAGTCLPLSQSTYSVKILDLRAGCILVSYDDNGCKKNPRELKNTGCWNLNGKYSVGFKC